MNYTDTLFIFLLFLLAAFTRLVQAFGRPGLTLKELVFTLVSWFLIATYGTFDLALLLIVAGINFAVAWSLERSRPGVARYILAAAIAGNIGVLAMFKYADLIFETAARRNWIQIPIFAFGIPLAMSFYIFHIISYLVDLAGGRAKRLPLLDYLFYLSFFPHVIAGPIIRTWQLRPQLKHRLQSASDLTTGIQYFIVGFALKSVAANNIGAAIDPFWTADGVTRLVAAIDFWAVAFLYYCEIYGDFAGYSLMALGMARLLGYRFPANFRAPMLAGTLQDFWRRWHITLSRWLRDYLYIPLGGSRLGHWRTTLNLCITMLLGGLWHGAGWNFAAWGAMHGLGLGAERWLRRFRGFGRIDTLGWFFCQAWVTLAWVFFRSPSVDFALDFIRHMFAFDGRQMSDDVRFIFIFATVPLAHHCAPLIVRLSRRRLMPWLLGGCTGIALVLCLTVYSPVKTFIYFRF